MSEGPPSEEVLRRGQPARAVVVRLRASGLRNERGVELHTLVLNVLSTEGPTGPAVQLTAVAALEPDELDLVREGAEIPISVLDGRGRVVAVDLDRARVERDTP